MTVRPRHRDARPGPAPYRRGEGTAADGRAVLSPEYVGPETALLPDRAATAPAVETLPVSCYCGRVVVNVPQADVRRGTFTPPPCRKCDG